MSHWSYDEMEEALEAVAPEPAPADPRERKRRLILDAATTLFIRHGYRRVSVDEVARAAGVAKGTVYLYFKTKADLLLHAVVEEKKRYLERFRPVLETQMPPRERLKAWLRTTLVVGYEMPLVSKLLSRDRELLLVLEELDTGLQDQALELKTDFLAGLLDEAAAPHRWTREEVRDRARVLIAIFQSANFFVEQRHRNGVEMERFAGLLTDILVDGLVTAATPKAAASNPDHDPVEVPSR